MLHPHLYQKLTIFIPLAGRRHCWRRLSKRLDELQLDKESCLLYLVDTSGDPGFAREVREWLARSDYVTNVFNQWRPYTDSECTPTELVDRPRTHFDFYVINKVMVDIYTLAQRMLSTPEILIIEDDIIPPVDVYERLVAARAPATYSVSGAYRIRNTENAWTAWRDLDSCNTVTGGTGVEEVKATGFGCLLMREADFKAASISWTPKLQAGRPWPWGYDMEFFSKVPEGRQVLVDWGTVCEHISNRES